MSNVDEWAVYMPPPPFVEPLDSVLEREIDAITGFPIPWSYLTYVDGKPRDSRFPWRFDEPGYKGPLPNQHGQFDGDSIDI